jgi:hypothetical protein
LQRFIRSDQFRRALAYPGLQRFLGITKFVLCLFLQRDVSNRAEDQQPLLSAVNPDYKISQTSQQNMFYKTL